jgi:ubiquinone/menaquinone biosynthesis C-methylase UbiE
MPNTELNSLSLPDDTDFVKFWNTVLAPKFIRFKHILVGGLTLHSEAIFPSLPVRNGDRVLDVGCGFGDTAMKLARLVGPKGKVVGVDCCDAFLETAEKEAQASGLRNIRFLRGDAEISLPFDAFDFVFARFGTMFFANPVAGLRNMRRALRPAGGWYTLSGAIAPIIPGCRWPATLCFFFYRHREKTRRPAAQAHSRCQMRARCEP